MHGSGEGKIAMKAIQYFPSQTDKTVEKKVFETFCNNFVFGHISSKETRPFYELYKRGKTSQCSRDAADDPHQCYNLQPYQQGNRDPPCFKGLKAEVKLNGPG